MNLFYHSKTVYTVDTTSWHANSSRVWNKGMRPSKRHQRARVRRNLTSVLNIDTLSEIFSALDVQSHTRAAVSSKDLLSVSGTGSMVTPFQPFDRRVWNDKQYQIEQRPGDKLGITLQALQQIRPQKIPFLAVYTDDDEQEELLEFLVENKVKVEELILNGRAENKRISELVTKLVVTKGVTMNAGIRSVQRPRKERDLLYLVRGFQQRFPGLQLRDLWPPDRYKERFLGDSLPPPTEEMFQILTRHSVLEEAEQVTINLNKTRTTPGGISTLSKIRALRQTKIRLLVLEGDNILDTEAINELSYFRDVYEIVIDIRRSWGGRMLDNAETGGLAALESALDEIASGSILAKISIKDLYKKQRSGDYIPLVLPTPTGAVRTGSRRR